MCIVSTPPSAAAHGEESMIVVRDIFKLHFGKAKDAIGHLKRGREILSKADYPVARILADVTSEYYTLVTESEVESLAAYEQGMDDVPGLEEWQEIYRDKFVPLVRHGRREIFRIVD